MKPQEEIITYLLINKYDLLFGMTNFPLAIMAGNGSGISIESIEEIKHISKDVWDDYKSRFKLCN
jgi:hypothetical protein